MRQLGLAWIKEGVPLRAYPYLVQARDQTPEDLEPRTKLAVVLASFGENAEARKEAAEILKLSPGDEEALIVFAETAQTPEEFEEVREELRKTPQEKEVSYHLGAASLAVQTKDVAYARAEFQAAVEAAPKSVRAHSALANFYWTQGDMDKADQEFRTAIELGADAPEPRLDYALFQKENDNVQGATAILEETTKVARDYQPARCALAEIALDEGRLDQAFELLERVLESDFANINARVLLADVRLAQGDAKKAAEEIEFLDQAYPNTPLIEYLLARVYWKKNDTPKAIIALNQAIAAKPDYAEAILLLGEINLRKGDATPVIPAMLGLLDQQPRLVPAQLMLAEAYRVSGRLDDAASTLREHINASPQSAAGYFRLGLILEQQHNAQEASEAFATAIDLAPDDLNAFDKLVDLEIAQNNFAPALTRVQQQLARTPESATVHLAEGKIYLAQKDWNRAESALRKAIELDPNFSSAYELLVSGYIAAGKVPQAISELEGMLSREPNSESALITSALIYDRIKDYSKARDVYEKVLSINPRFTDALNNLAYLYAEHFNDLAKAYDLARRARILAPENPAIADTLGWILYKQGHYQEALNVLEESARAFSENPEVQLHFGMASYMMNQLEAARTAFGKAVAAAGDSPTGQEAAKWLDYVRDDSGSSEKFSTNELETLVQNRPNDPVAHMRLGTRYQKDGQAAQAATQYDAAIALNPNLATAKLRLAELYAGPLHDFGKALELAKAARELTGSDPQIDGILGGIAYKSGNFAWAHSLLQESSRQLPTNETVLHDFAWSAYSLGKVNQARETMRRLVELSPSSDLAEDAAKFLKITAFEADRPASAESEIDQLLTKDQHYTPALFAKGVLQARRGNTKEAIEIFNKILKDFPDFAPAQKQLASFYLEDPDRISEAYELATKARNTIPDDEELWQMLGEISYKRRDFGNAIEWFEESARKKPLPARDLYYLGVSQLRTSQNAKSAKTLEAALNAGLPEPMLTEVRALLAKPGAGASP